MLPFFFISLPRALFIAPTISSIALDTVEIGVYCESWFVQCVPLFALTVHQTVCSNALANSMRYPYIYKIHRQNRLNRWLKRHKNDFKKKSAHTHKHTYVYSYRTETILRERAQLNVPIKKITNVNNNRISASTSIWLDMCECWECTLVRAHVTLLCTTILLSLFFVVVHAVVVV